MSYNYEYTYPKDKSAVGYKGPSPIYYLNGSYGAGIVEPAKYVDLLRAALERILGTRQGERVMQPEFGMNLHTLLFDPLDKTFLQDVRLYIINGLMKQEPRLTLKNLDFEPDEDNQTLNVSLTMASVYSGEEIALNFAIR